MGDGFATTVEAHLASMLRAALAVTDDREAAADAVQEALFRAWRAWERLPPGADAGAWLHTIARREALRGRSRRRPEAELPEGQPGGPDPADAAQARWEREAVAAAVEALPARQREALWLRYAAEAPIAVIAARMGLPPGTVKSHLHRGRHALRAALLHGEALGMDSLIRRLETLVRSLEEAGTAGSPAVAAALRAVPRHAFLPNLAEKPGRTPTGGWWAERDGTVDPDAAYRDARVLVRSGRDAVVCMSPGWAATVLQALDVRPGHRVHEVQSGTGYVTALLARLAGPEGRVDGAEPREAVAAMARGHLAGLRAQGHRVMCGSSDGAMVGSDDALLDRVLATATVGDVSPFSWPHYAEGAVVVAPLAVGGLPVLVRLALRESAGGDLNLRGRVLQRVPEAEGEAWVEGALGWLGGAGPGEWDRGMRHRDRMAFFDAWEPIVALSPLAVAVEVPAEARGPGAADGLRLFARLHRPDARIGAMRGTDIRLVDLEAGGDLIVDPEAGRGELRGAAAMVDHWRRLVEAWIAAGAPRIGDFRVGVAEPGAAPVPGRWMLPATWHSWAFDLEG